MSAKRASDADDAPSSSKKRRTFHNTTQRSGKNAHAAVDQTYGQRNAFGSLDDIGTTAPAGDSDLDCEDDTDALAYLRTVRQQAATIPHIVVAKRAGPQPPPSTTTTGADADYEVDRDIYNDGRGDFRGYYHDGAYIACPDEYKNQHGDSDSSHEAERDDDDDEDDGEISEGVDQSSEWSSDSSRPHNSSVDEIRQAYFESLTQRYLSLRGVVQRDPPDSAVTALPRTHPTEVADFNGSRSTFPQWSGRLRGTDPLPAQIAAMHKDSIIRLLRIVLSGKFLRKGVELLPRTSTWIWALLARLPDRGELDYQEVGWVRDLGKRAVLLMIGLAEAQVLQEEYGVGASEDDGHEGDVDMDEHYEDNADFDAAGPDAAGTEADTELELKDKDGDSLPAVTQEVPDDEDAPMDLDDGEVSEADQEQHVNSTDLEDVKARLLAQLDQDHDSNMDMVAQDLSVQPEEQDPVVTAAQINARATLNMILTVAGEFYGQLDLLEFRDPFGSL